MQAGEGIGEIKVRAEEVFGRPDDTLKLKMEGINIANKDGFLKGASDPYLVFKRVRQSCDHRRPASAHSIFRQSAAPTPGRWTLNRRPLT